MKITDMDVWDIRFPTSKELHGSDAMNKDPDYSAAYVVLQTDGEHEGHGLTFTLGRGNELCVEAVKSLYPLVVGRNLPDIIADMSGFWRSVASDSQIRWVGPEKGVIHMATGAIINAVWDLYAKQEGKPLWKLLADMPAEEIVAAIDFRHITDALTPEEALAILKENDATRGEREADLLENGFPAYTTSAGWLGYPDDLMRKLCREALADGMTHIKIKVGRDIKDDMRRSALIREEIGPDLKLMMDANQVWDVGDAIENMKQLAEFDPWFIEEPTSPDDILGHLAIKNAISPIRVATGEMCQNRIMFKQFLMSGAMDVCQIDSCRVGGVNEVLAIILMAKKYGVPVCPHAGGVGLCEYVQHLSMFDYIRVSATTEDRVIEFVDHLHEHFEEPVVMKDGAYMPPKLPGYSITMKPQSLKDYEFPHGRIWKEENA